MKKYYIPLLLIVNFVLLAQPLKHYIFCLNNYTYQTCWGAGFFDLFIPTMLIIFFDALLISGYLLCVKNKSKLIGSVLIFTAIILLLISIAGIFIK